MNRRHACFGLLALIALTGGGCQPGGDIATLIGGLGNAAPGPPADITITSVTTGPAPSQPGAGTLTVTVNYQVNQPGGTAAIVVWLFDDDDFLRFQDDELVAVVQGASAATAGPGSMSTSFVLTCGGPDGDEVIGGQNGTGEGHSVFLLGTDEAEIRAAARPDTNTAATVVVSDLVEMWCE